MNRNHKTCGIEYKSKGMNSMNNNYEHEEECHEEKVEKEQYGPNEGCNIIKQEPKVTIYELRNIQEIKDAFVHHIPHNPVIFHICEEEEEKKEQLLQHLYGACYVENIQPQAVAENILLVDKNCKAPKIKRFHQNEKPFE